MKEIYAIRVKDHLDQARSGWFDGLTITHTADGETIFLARLLIKPNCTVYLPKYEIWAWSCLK